MATISYYLTDHPTVVGFRWSPDQSWGSTWYFLISSLTLYILSALLLHCTLLLFGRCRPVPLGPIPALHSLLMSSVSAVIFLGLLLSSLAEIRDTRWFWHRTRITSPLQWLLCFPLGTRPTGRVFFWSYAFYLSRFLHLFRTIVSILRRRPHALSGVFSHAALVCMSFLWLEFSQSFQIIAILSATAAHFVVFGYRFWVGIGLPGGSSGGCFPVVLGCQLALLGCNLVCHLGVLLLHLWKDGGCNGFGAWVFNTVLNGMLLMPFLNFHLKRVVRQLKRMPPADEDNEECGSVRRRPPPELMQVKEE